MTAKIAAGVIFNKLTSTTAIDAGLSPAILALLEQVVIDLIQTYGPEILTFIETTIIPGLCVAFSVRQVVNTDCPDDLMTYRVAIRRAVLDSRGSFTGEQIQSLMNEQGVSM